MGYCPLVVWCLPLANLHHLGLTQRFPKTPSATPWATATNNVKKLPSKKGRTFIKLKIYVTCNQSDSIDFLIVCPFLPGHPLEPNMCK